MKVYGFLSLFFILTAVSFPADAAEIRSERWDNLIEFAHKFTWYPNQDIQELLRAKSNEFQQSLEEYQNILITELTDGAAPKRSINPELFVTPKPWKLYYRLAIAQFCSYLAHGDTSYLKNAISVMSVISGKREVSNISFWQHLFGSYDNLGKKDRDGFMTSVFRLWNDAVMQAEINQAITQSKAYLLETSDLQHFYENTAHLIITKAIIEEQLPNLHPLSAIVISLNEKLAHENGYKRFVEAICERLKGLKSDNNNLNFAVAFVEATADQYEFEEETSPKLIGEKFNTTRLAYNLALSWANTHKGQAAILTQHLGFNNYVVRRLTEKDPMLVSNDIFLEVPNQASQLADTSMTLYHQLAKSSNRQDRFIKDGFHKRSNYIEASHQLWDSIAKLLLTLTSYNETLHPGQKVGETGLAEAFLLKYLAFFRHYTQENIEIVPDNAFYMAAYASSRLAALYREAKQYSKSMHYHNLTFAYQLQAVELFPLDIAGIMKLAYQTDQENRPRIYFQYVAPLATRLRDSSVVWTWLDKDLQAHRGAVEISATVVPDVVENAFIYLNVLQQTKAPQTEEGLFNKLIVMNGLYMTLKSESLDDLIPDTLAAVSRYNFSADNVELSKVFTAALPLDSRNSVTPPPELESGLSIKHLKNELYASPDNRIHAFLRELYFEDTVKIHQQLLKLK
ncbi:MAG: hypothetical protein V2I56_14005 [Desulfobacteraceae bacterium]|jgi:hypothetical protein|nr:hypothetical protein [Desulfobacteraceae bacterium]